MNKEENKHIEKFIDNTMKEINLESPSIDFTNTVMKEVTMLKSETVVTYQPLISKKLWLLIFSVIIGMTGYIILKGNLKQLNWLDNNGLNLEGLLPNISFSNTTFYILLVAASLIFIQIILLKNYFNKRLAL